MFNNIVKKLNKINVNVLHVILKVKFVFVKSQLIMSLSQTKNQSLKAMGYRTVGRQV